MSQRIQPRPVFSPRGFGLYLLCPSCQEPAMLIWGCWLREPWRGLASSQSALLIATHLSRIRGWWPVPWCIPFSPSLQHKYFLLIPLPGGASS